MSFSWPVSVSAPSSSTSIASRPTRGRLAAATRVEVGAGAQDQGLAGVEALAATDHGGESLLRAQLFVAPAPLRAGRPTRVDLVRGGEATGGHLLAAAMADPDRRSPLGAQFGAERIGARDRVRVQHPVEQGERLGDRGVAHLLGGSGLLEPALRVLT